MMVYLQTMGGWGVSDEEEASHCLYITLHFSLKIDISISWCVIYKQYIGGGGG